MLTKATYAQNSSVRQQYATPTPSQISQRSRCCKEKYPVDPREIPQHVMCDRHALLPGLVYTRDATSRQQAHDAVQDASWLGSLGYNPIPPASIWRLSKCSTPPLDNTTSSKPAPSKLHLSSIHSTVECPTGWCCPGTLAWHFQAANVPGASLVGTNETTAPLPYTNITKTPSLALNCCNPLLSYHPKTLN